jgi:hypothetical protein
MAIIRLSKPSYSSQIKRYGNYDPFRTEEIAYAKNPTGKGVVRVNITNVASEIKNAIITSDKTTASKIVYSFSNGGRNKIKGHAQQTMMDVFQDYFGLTRTQKAQVQDVIEQLTIEDFEIWAKENKFMVREFWSYYRTRKSMGEGGTESVRDMYFDNIIGELKTRFGIQDTNRYNDF